MIRDSAQFQAFDGLDNRKELMRMLTLLGGDFERGRFLKRLALISPMGRLAQVRDCEPTDAYFYLLALTNLPGITIERAARELEREVRRL